MMCVVSSFTIIKLEHEIVLCCPHCHYKYSEVILCFKCVSSVHMLEHFSEQFISLGACNIKLSQAKTFVVIQTLWTASP